MVDRIELRGAKDEELVRISTIMGLALNLEEMKKIQNYFKSIDREPTDVELQSIAQAWSEHCCYKSSKPVLKRFIFGIKAPQCIDVIEEDAGVVALDGEFAYVVAFESHNHPSTIEPYGGAATGIGGIVRDVICMGAQPVALIDPLFFAPLDYPYERLPADVKHPRFLFNGVVSGISDYGNRIGIPTCAGMVYFHDRYAGNCVVNVGCVGVMKRKDLRRSSARAGDVLVLAGGKTGRDGIHGVTFASGVLKESEEYRSAVQLGDPITKEPLMHAILECNDQGLIDGMKDLGGGGLSCAVSEMCYSGGCGAEIHLERVKLKESGLHAWEIWISESQERFLLSVTPDKVDSLLTIFDKWDVDATVIGDAVSGSHIRLYYHDELVFDLDVAFVLDTPVYERPKAIPNVESEESDMDEPDSYDEILKMLLASPNIASRESIIRRYDHEVRAATVLKPLQGIMGKETHADATVLKPLESSFKGIAITADVNPAYCELNPFWGAASAIDEACRNLTAVGAVPHSFADCLNFGNPEKPQCMGEFYECCRGLGYMASSIGVPFVSGNVSFYNESEALGVSIPPTPAILGIGICDDIRECVTVDVKAASNPLYVVGTTKRELGGSAYYRLRGEKCGIVPRTDPEVLKVRMAALRDAMAAHMVASCHDISDGGLAVAVCEMLIGGDLGADIDISDLNTGSESGRLRSDYKLFSESNTRWVVEVWRDVRTNFEKLMHDRGIVISAIGYTKGERMITMRDGAKKLVELPLEELSTVWRAGIA